MLLFKWREPFFLFCECVESQSCVLSAKPVCECLAWAVSWVAWLFASEWWVLVECSVVECVIMMKAYVWYISLTSLIASSSCRLCFVVCVISSTSMTSMSSVHSQLLGYGHTQACIHNVSMHRYHMSMSGISCSSCLLIRVV